jgi:hypothetical protein
VASLSGHVHQIEASEDLFWCGRLLMFRRTAYVPHCFPDRCNEGRFTKGQFLPRPSVKGNRVGARLQQKRLCESHTISAVLVFHTRPGSAWRQLHLSAQDAVAVFFNFQFNNTASKRKPLFSIPVRSDCIVIRGSGPGQVNISDGVTG